MLCSSWRAFDLLGLVLFATARHDRSDARLVLPSLIRQGGRSHEPRSMHPRPVYTTLRHPHRLTIGR